MEKSAKENFYDYGINSLHITLFPENRGELGLNISTPVINVGVGFLSVTGAALGTP